MTVLTPTLAEDVFLYESRTAVSQPLTGRNPKGRERCVNSNYRVWTRTGKVGERMCKGKSVSDVCARV